MTTERKKAILILSGVLIVGFLAGFLTHGFVFNYQRHKFEQRGGRGHMTGNRKDWFIGTIYRIIQPDSTQAKAIKPITGWAATQIDSLEQYSNHRLAEVLDSVKAQLKPIVTDEQYKRLSEFDARAKGHWRGGRRR